jgi:hypothetical protein
MPVRLRCLVVHLLVLGCANAADPICRVELNDVHPFWGGTSVVLKAKGELVVSKLTPPKEGEPGLREHRSRGAVDFARTVADLGLDGLKDFRMPVRTVAPKDARSTIVIYYASGDRKVIAKWADEKDPAVDAVYRRLLKLAETDLIGEYDGRYTDGLGE